MGIKEDWDLVRRYQKEIILFGGVSSLLGWDEETYIPKKGIRARSEQNALIAELSHSRMIDNGFFDAVDRLKKEKLSGDEKLLIERLHKDLSKARKIPVEFVVELAKEKTLSAEAWKKAKEKSDFSIFEPHLKKMVSLMKRYAGYIGLPGHPYNSLLNDYEEGMSADKLKSEFAKLKEGLVILLNKIKSSKRYKEQKNVLNGKFPGEKQMALAKDVIKRIGLGEDNSRIDFSAHPFSTKIGAGDVRITTSLRNSLLFLFESSIHEAGHGLYTLNYPSEHEYDFLGWEPSLGMHESQSRFWENMISKGGAFWKFYSPKFKKEFGLGMSAEEFYNQVNLVTPGKIRIESDEVHYCLHIILRFEIELGLFDGSIDVKELPKVWNKKFKELFGVEIKNDSEGVLQDVHWCWGNFGYFPTYAIGTIYASQLYNAIKKDMPGVEKQIESGEFGKIGEWLEKNVHKHGRKFLAEEIMKKACGEGLNSDVFIGYLNEKYSRIYDF